MTDSDRYDALKQLLALPDPPDLPTRSRRYVQPGDPHRREIVKRDLSRAYLRHRIAAAGIEETVIGAVRRSPLRLVRTQA